MTSEFNRGTNSKRKLRQQRPDVFRDWCEGRVEGNEISGERRTREGSRSRSRKKSKGIEFGMTLEPVGKALLVEQHRRTCEISLGENHVETARYHPQLNLRDFGMLAVGDLLDIQKDPRAGEYYICGVDERESKLSRPGPPDREHREQVLAANLDQVVVVVSLHQPEFNPGLVDRYMMVCQNSEIPMVLVINKVDLATEDLPERIEQFRPYLEDLILTSTKSDAGLADLRARLEGRRSVLTGQSGVGKSSLIKALFPEQDIRTGDVRSGDGKGRHTTTHSTLFYLKKGWVIDTPGIRRLGFWQMDPVTLAQVFPFFRKIGGCHFNDCLHLAEPGCQVQLALKEGRIAKFMYQSYLRMRDSI